MKPCLLISCVLLPLCTISAEPVNWPIEKTPKDQNPAACAIARNEWMEAFTFHRSIAKSRHVDVVLQGDSITAAWPPEVIRRILPQWEIACFGISGDRVENVLWRTKNGELEGISPRVIVLLIGTNNLRKGHSPEQIAEGIAVLVDEMHKAVPGGRIVLMALLPRGQHPDDPYREKVYAVNGLISHLAKKPYVAFLDIGSQLLSADGTISREIMSDGVHLTPRGYEIWAQNLKPLLMESASSASK